MATLAPRWSGATRDDDRFFRTMAFVMAAIIVAGFGLQLAAGRSTFARPPVVHAHAITFMGWMVIYVLQTVFATRGPIALHRRLGWIAVGWLLLMNALGLAVTLSMVRNGHVPFFFQPLHFLIFDPVMLMAATTLFFVGVSFRNKSDWHRRLNFCGMAILTGPAFGRLLPMPFLIPWAYQAAFLCTLVLPIVGMIADRRRDGRIHPAWLWGFGAMIATELAIDAITYSPVGQAVYAHVTAGTPGAGVAPLAFGPLPPGM